MPLNKSGLQDVFFTRDENKHLDIWDQDNLIIDQIMQNIMPKKEEEVSLEVVSQYQDEFNKEVQRKAIDYHLRNGVKIGGETL